MLTNKQRIRLMELAQRAHRDEFASGVNFDEWRHRICREACGKASTGDMNTGLDFDACMLMFAEIAQDEKAIRYFASAVERRMRHRIGVLLRQLGDLEGSVYTWRYARAICAHMQLPETMEEATTADLRRVIAALDTHRRRIMASRREHTPRRSNQGLGSRRNPAKGQKVVAA